MKDNEDMALRIYGRSSVSEYLGDFMVYRSLNPCDPRLPGYAECSLAAGVPSGRLPRKHEDGYARLVVHLLKAARCLGDPAARLKRLIYLGDTRLSDATAFRNLCLAGGWDGLAFICSEDSRRPPTLRLEEREVQGEGVHRLYNANRWALLSELETQRQSVGFPVDEETVVVVDLDKTAIGARGRNAQVIDQARQHAVQVTVADVLGKAFDESVFQEAYNALNQPEFHNFTEDNQDYLAYVCLAIGSGRYGLEGVMAKIRSGELVTFEQFIAGVDVYRLELPVGFGDLHTDFYACMRAGDPTPFKAFRRSEYRLTASRMGSLPDGAPLAQILAEEIVITQEVQQAGLEWKARGALIFGLSDKPDEASLPDKVQASQGWLPLHRLETHAVGTIEGR